MQAHLNFLRSITRALARSWQAWCRFWFQRTPTTPLEIARIGIGAAMFVNYLLATPYLLDFWGDDGWVMPRSFLDLSDPWQQSIFFYFSDPWQWVVFHVLFLLSCLAFALGWRTSVVKWVVLIGQISYAQRNPILVYGVDKILVSLLFILCLAPIGRALSLDRLRAVRAAKCADLRAMPPPFRSRWAGACTRMMQIQMAVLFFYSGLEKIRGDDWWNGNAVWFVFTAEDLYNDFLLRLFASHYWLVNAATYGTILIELSYPFLIWQRRTRPYLLAAAIFLHLQFGTWMGMPYFSLVMIMGHMSFVRPEWLARIGLAWKQAMGDMEMIYDGKCGFCVRSMAWFLSFDGLRQIRTRNFRTDPSPLVSDAEMEKALYLVLPNGRTLPGFEAYRYVVLRVPGLWWQVPLFYLPVLSRLIGHPIYNWIAANRSRLSYLRLGCPPAPAQAANVA
jgi:predicted DCC family thiol-disulfide oxidoreductase YuxK